MRASGIQGVLLLLREYRSIKGTAPVEAELMRIAGAFVTGGAILLIVIALMMDASVPTAMGRVHNLSLATQQQNILLVGVVLLLLGVILLIKAPGTRARKCPFCAEMIQPDAVVCHYCGRDVPKVAVADRGWFGTSPPPGMLPWREQVREARWILGFCVLLGLLFVVDYVFRFDWFKW
jgi:hypothetical protein